MPRYSVLLLVCSLETSKIAYSGDHMSRLLWGLVLSILMTGLAVSAETVVFSGEPISKVESRLTDTTHYPLEPAAATEYRVLITKLDGKYYWASRENKELLHFQSDAADWFISASSGYVKIVDRRSLGDDGEPRYIYIEHLTLLLDTITYWGVGAQLSP